MRLEGRKMCLKKGIECEVVGNGRKQNAVCRWKVRLEEKVE